jgi:uncharacterized protein YciI
MFYAFVSLALISLPPCVTVPQSPSKPTGLAKGQKLWLMFFMRGTGERPKETSVLEKMQADHIANLGEQWRQKHLLIAGPLGDPTKERRGITVAIAKERSEIDSFFKTDPYVQNRIMSVAAWEWFVPVSKFQTPSDEQSMSEYRMILCTRSLSNAERTKLTSVAVGGRLAHRKPEAMKSAIEAYIVESVRESAVNACLNTQNGIEVIPLWMSKGVLKP